jgi:hypothetical protein
VRWATASWGLWGSGRALEPQLQINTRRRPAALGTVVSIGALPFLHDRLPGDVYEPDTREGPKATCTPSFPLFINIGAGPWAVRP